MDYQRKRKDYQRKNTVSGNACSSNADVAKLADAQVSGSCGQPYGFKSLHPHHNLAIKKILPEEVLIFQGFFVFYCPMS